MLVLSRKQKQQIKIGDDVVLTVLQVKGNTVRLGIEAPREVHVVRGELDELPKPEPAKSRLAISKEQHAAKADRVADKLAKLRQTVKKPRQTEIGKMRNRTNRPLNHRNRILELSILKDDSNETEGTELNVQNNHVLPMNPQSN